MDCPHNPQPTTTGGEEWARKWGWGRTGYALGHIPIGTIGSCTLKSEQRHLVGLSPIRRCKWVGWARTSFTGLHAKHIGGAQLPALWRCPGTTGGGWGRLTIDCRRAPQVDSGPTNNPPLQKGQRAEKELQGPAPFPPQLGAPFAIPTTVVGRQRMAPLLRGGGPENEYHAHASHLNFPQGLHTFSASGQGGFGYCVRVGRYRVAVPSNFFSGLPRAKKSDMPPH